MSLIVWSNAPDSVLKKVASPIISKTPVQHRVFSDVSKLPDAARGDVVLACGTAALDLLKEIKLFPKNRTTGSLRESPAVHEGVTYLITYDPRLSEVDYALLSSIQWDTRLACRIVTTGSATPKVGDYRWVESLHELIARIEQKYEETGKPVNVSSDLETKGLDEYHPEAWIVSIFFTVDAGRSDGLYFQKGESPQQPDPWEKHEDMTYWEGLWAQINWILTSPKVSLRGANWKYDSRWLNKKWLIECTNHKFDTTLVGSLLDENRSNSLKLHAKVMTDLGGYEDGIEDYDMGSMELIPLDKLVVYAGGDTDATLQVADVMKAELLKDKRLTNFYVNLLHPSSHTFERMERNGIPVDVPYYDKLESELEIELKRLEGEMLKQVPWKLRHKYSDKIAEAQEKDKSPFGNAKFIQEFLFSSNGLNLKPFLLTAKTKEPSTAIDHLMMFEDNPDAKAFVDLMKQHGSASKTLSTFVRGFRKHLRSDGRFHPHYMLFRGDYGDDDSGANSGRTSAKDPAVQTISKHTKWAKRLRRAYVAPKGKNILQMDYSQGELKIAAVLAEEPAMLDAYLNGKDLHAITAASLNGYELEEFMLLPEDVRDELRSGGKAGNFGLLYGMGANGFRIYAQNSYGVYMTEEEASIKRDAFFAKYARLTGWHNEAKQFARMQGFIRSPLGRVRHLPLINSKDSGVRSKAERQAVNAPVQATLSDMMQLSMSLIDAEYGQDQIQMWLMTHDSCNFFVPLGEEVVWAKRLKLVMENLPLKRVFGWDSPLKFTVDAEMGVPDDEGIISFAKLQKMKNL